MKAKLLSVSFVTAIATAASWAQAPADTASAQTWTAAPMTHLAVGTVRSIDASARSVTIDHQAIPSLNMPAMTMQFRLPGTAGVALKAGQSIAFTFTPSAEGLTIGSVQPVTMPVATGPAGPVTGQARYGMDHNRMPGMQDKDMQSMQGMADMKAMMDSCHAMTGGR